MRLSCDGNPVISTLQDEKEPISLICILTNIHHIGRGISIGRAERLLFQKLLAECSDSIQRFSLSQLVYIFFLFEHERNISSCIEKQNSNRMSFVLKTIYRSCPKNRIRTIIQTIEAKECIFKKDVFFV